MSTDPRAIYVDRVARFSAERARADRSASRASHARLAAFAVAVGAGLWAEQTAHGAAYALLAAAVLAFVSAVVVHRKLEERAARLRALVELNELGPARIDRAWERLPERPAPAEATGHHYADDLDLFGHASLVQLLGPVGTAAGRRTLWAWLLAPGELAEVRRRQEAIAELAGARDARDRAAAHALRAGAVAEDELAPLLGWAEGGPPAGPGAFARALAWGLPAATWLLAALDVAGVVDRGWWVLGLLAATAFTFAGPGARARSAFTRAFAREGIFRGFPELLRSLTEPSFRAAALRDLQARLVAASGADPAARIEALGRLMHLSDLRRSGMLYLPIQLLTMWDLHVHAALERWRRETGPRLRGWLEAAGEFEALSALATLAHDQPGWAYPEFVAEPILVGRALGHPLLPDATRVANDVTVGPPGTFLHVTGSNMSGKSTLLRALGLNAVLAQAGGPVCAAAMRLPPLAVRSSIRVRDSLERGVSYFMAELERLKAVVDAASQPAFGRRVLFLLDEILHGTNTAERRVAARRVLAHLMDAGAIGAVTTHDLELLDAELSSAAVPVHFRETIVDAERGGMTFDYLLRPGMATSTNALALMRLVGLDGERPGPGRPAAEAGSGAAAEGGSGAAAEGGSGAAADA